MCMYVCMYVCIDVCMCVRIPLRACVKEPVVFTFLVLYLILVHSFSTRKDKTYCPVFVFRRGICNAICDLVLYKSYQGLNLPSICDNMTVQSRSRI